MGALQKIRSKSTLLVAVIAVGLLAFVIPWGEITQFLNVSKDKAFVVDGDVVKTRQYSTRIEQAEELEKSRSGGRQLTEARVAQIRDEVFQTMVAEKLLADQADKLGLAVTDAELNNLAKGFNMSPVLYELFGNMQTGEFDQEALNSYIEAVNQPLSSDPQTRAYQENLRAQWANIENMMRFNRLSEKYASLVASTVLVNNLEAKAYFEGTQQVADLAYVVSEYKNVDDASIEVTDKELQDLYNIRKENFLSKYPLKNVTYFVKDVLPSETDYSETEAQALDVKEELLTTENPGLVVSQYSTTQYIDAHFAINSLPVEIRNFVNGSNVGDVYGPTREDKGYTMYKYVSKVVAPDSVSLQTLPIQSIDPMLSASIADSLQNVLKQGKSFVDLAKEMYPGVPQVGQTEWVSEVALAQVGIADQCFNASIGDVIKVQMGGMTSLVKIVDKTRPVAKAKVAVVTIPVIVSDRTNNSIDNEINQFLSENKDPQNFVQAALSKGYNVQENVVVYPHQAGLDNVASSREVIRWAFNDSKGEIKKFETKDARILAVVTGSAEAGYLPVTNSEVKDILKNEILVDKKAEKLIADLKAANKASLEDLAEFVGSKVDTAKFVTFQTNNINGVGYEPIMNVYSKVADIASVSSPLKGRNGVYVLKVIDKKADEGEYNETVIKNMLQGNYFQMLSYSASFMLMNKMDVEDNRIKFY